METIFLRLFQLNLNPRIRANSLAPLMERNPPDIFCLHFFKLNESFERNYPPVIPSVARGLHGEARCQIAGDPSLRSG